MQHNFTSLFFGGGEISSVNIVNATLFLRNSKPLKFARVARRKKSSTNSEFKVFYEDV